MTFRKEKVAEVLIGFLAQEVRRLNDERLMLLTITNVKVSPDLKYANVFWSMPVWKIEMKKGKEQRVLTFPDAEEQEKLNNILIGNKTLLKKQIAKGLKLRYTPELRFEYDYSEEQASKIESLIDGTGRNIT